MNTRPIELKRQTLERLWVEFVSKNPSPEKYCEIARIVPLLRNQAWQKYAESKPAQHELLKLMDNPYWKSIRAMPASLLMELYPSDEILSLVMGMVPDLACMAAKKLLDGGTKNPRILEQIIGAADSVYLKQRAAEKILADNPGFCGLMKIISEVPVLGAKAGRILIERNPAQDVLTIVFSRVASLRNEIWEIAKKQEDNLYLLVAALDLCPELRPEAGRMILAKALPDDRKFALLLPVAKHVPELRESVWQQLAGTDMSDTWLEALAREAPELKERALARRKPPVRDMGSVFNEILMVEATTATIS